MAVTQPIAVFVKAPGSAALDYSIDWSQWLNGDTIASSSWAGIAGTLTTSANVFSSTVTTIFIAAGTDGTTYDLTNTIVTVGGKTEPRTIRIVVLSR